MIQVGDLVKHKHIGGLGLVKSINTVVVKDSGRTKNQYQAKIQWLINPYEGGGYTVLWTKHLEKSENK
jgi:hypothetical protein